MVLSVVMLSACVGEPLPLEPSDSGDEACLATLAVAPSSLSIGVVERDRAVARSVEVSLTNDGTASCRVVASELRVDDATPIRTRRALVLEAGATSRWTEELVIENGTRPVPRMVATLMVDFERRDPLSAHVSIAATTSASSFVVAPASLDFRSHPVGCDVRRTLTVFNTKSKPQTILATLPRSAPFVVEGEATGIGSGEVREFVVTMRLADVGDHSATIRFEAEDAEIVDVPLHGRGTPRGPCD